MRPTWAVSGPESAGAAQPASLWYLVVAEEESAHIGRIRLLRVPNTFGASLCDAVSQCVEPGGVVHTDGLRSYAGLGALGYRHEVTRESGAPVGEDRLPRVHRVASPLKRWILSTHHGAIRPSHLDYYLDGFTFRFNRRTSRSRGKLFYRLAQQRMAVDPLPQSKLRGGKSDETTTT